MPSQDSFLPEQFEAPRRPRVRRCYTPQQKVFAQAMSRSAVLWAIILLVLGLFLIAIGSLLMVGAIPSNVDNVASRAWPLILLGVLLLIPGGYHVRLAYRQYQGSRGYDYSELMDPNELDL